MGDKQKETRCSVCGKKDCPCPVCHGDPKRYLGGIHAGKADHRTGYVRCTNCGLTGGQN